jgi:dihydrofolate reductase
MAVGKVVAGISVSLDGFIAGPNDGPENGLGDGGERLHEWLYDLASWRARHGREGGKTGPADDLLAEAMSAGATVIGRRMFDNAEQPWGEEPPFHHQVFVLTHRPRDPIVKRGGTTFTFVEEPLEAVLERARSAAGGEKVAVNGGRTIQQFLEAGLLDELQLQLVPVFLGGGPRLFDGVDPQATGLECVDAIVANRVAHLRYRLAR